MPHNVIELLGWTLLHFVWQGFAVGLLAAVVLTAMRRRSANARYLTAVAALSAMAVLPAVASNEPATSAASRSSVNSTGSPTQ